MSELSEETLDALVHPDVRKQARAIQARLSQDLSFAALWKRLDQAERDRNRMLNALQTIRDGRRTGDVIMKPRMWTILHRALSRTEPSIAAKDTNA